jgi:hypothetical protein
MHRHPFRLSVGQPLRWWRCLYRLTVYPSQDGIHIELIAALECRQFAPLEGNGDRHAGPRAQ